MAIGDYSAMTSGRDIARLVKQTAQIDEHDDRDSLRRWLREALSGTGWSGAELGRRSGVSATTINRFLNNDDAPTLGYRSLRKIQKVVAAKLGNVNLLEQIVGAGTPAGRAAREAMEDEDIARAMAPHKATFVEIDGAEFASIPRYDAALSAGAGSIIDPDADPIGYHLIEAQWLRTVTRSSPARLAVLRVSGDSMEDTLHGGDWILVDRSQTRASDEGVYALQVGESTWVKRLTLNLRDQLIQVISDNPKYPMQELPEDDLEVIGKVVCLVARKM